MDVDALKAAVCAEVDRLADQLLHASHEIHAHPELNFEEHFAHDLLIDHAATAGLRHRRATPTASTPRSRQRSATSGFNVAVLCEYDALPGIGHACGHNVIATAGLGAGLAAAARGRRRPAARVRIMGTPAEEGGGGKIDDGPARRVRRRRRGDDGAPGRRRPDRDGLHRPPGAARAVPRQGRARRGRAVDGRNALDAAVLGYMNIAALRQHIRPTERIHGVFTKGGDKANIVPAETAMEWIVRSATIESLQPLKQRVLTCLESAATACGCTIDHEWHAHTYADMIDNGPMVAAYVANAARVGRTVRRPGQRRPAGGRQHRHGQHQLPRALDPPDDQGRRRRRADPHPGVRRVGEVSRRRPGGARRGQGDGDDDRRPVDVGRPPSGDARRRSPIGPTSVEVL